MFSANVSIKSFGWNGCQVSFFFIHLLWDFTPEAETLFLIVFSAFVLKNKREDTKAPITGRSRSYLAALAKWKVVQMLLKQYLPLWTHMVFASIPSLPKLGLSQSKQFYIVPHYEPPLGSLNWCTVLEWTEQDLFGLSCELHLIQEPRVLDTHSHQTWTWDSGFWVCCLTPGMIKDVNSHGNMQSESDICWGDNYRQLKNWGEVNLVKVRWPQKGTKMKVFVWGFFTESKTKAEAIVQRLIWALAILGWANGGWHTLGLSPWPNRGDDQSSAHARPTQRGRWSLFFLCLTLTWLDADLDCWPLVPRLPLLSSGSAHVSNASDTKLLLFW